MARFSTSPKVDRLEDRCTPATLSGVVFADVNANGIQDAGEAGLSGVTVQASEAANPTPITAVTDANGQFVLAGVPDGTASLTATPLTGSTLVGGPQSVPVAGGADVNGLAIGLQPGGKVTGSAFADLNNNGVRDPGETGVAGAIVSLDALSNGSVDFTATTQADGTYSFDHVPDGTHSLSVAAPVNFVARSAAPQTVAISGGAAVTAADSAMSPATAVAGRVTLGDTSAGQPGIPGMTVELDAFSDGKIDYTTVTDSTGAYAFTNIPSGTHTITVVAPPGTTFNVPAGVNKQTALVNGNILNGVNFGITPPGSVTGGLYLDLNGDGQRETGEPGLASGQVQVDLFNSGHPIDVPTKATGDGTFSISGLPDGTHTLIITPPAGYTSAGPTRLPFTINNGTATSTAQVGLRAGLSSTLTIGNGTSGGAQSYTFTPGQGGSLVTVPGRSFSVPNSTGVRVVTADFNGDGTEDVITATGPGQRATIHVYDGKTGAELVAGGIPVFESSFIGGLNLAAGDFNHDGKADVVVSADTGGGPRVQVLNAAQFLPGADSSKGLLLADFLGIDDANFRGGTRVAVGDLNNDGTPDLIVAAGQGGGPRVAIFDGQSISPDKTPTRLVGDFFTFESALRNGATVAVGDVDGDGHADLIAGAGPGGAPRVEVFSGVGIMGNFGSSSQRVADFYVNADTQSRGGTRIAVKDLDQDGKADIVATNGSKAYVYTSAGIAAYFNSPMPGQTSPGNSATLEPFGDNPAGLFVG
jgi:hypothetical protein